MSRKSREVRTIYSGVFEDGGIDVVPQFYRFKIVDATLEAAEPRLR
jgi:hypothetical protein